VVPFVHPSTHASVQAVCKPCVLGGHQHFTQLQVSLDCSNHSTTHSSTTPTFAAQQVTYPKHTTFLPVYPPAHSTNYSRIYSPTYLSIIPSTHKSIHPSIHLSIHPFIHSFIHQSTYPSIHPSVCPSIHPFIHQSNHPSILHGNRQPPHILSIIPSTHPASRPSNHHISWIQKHVYAGWLISCVNLARPPSPAI
jgi:hypothetical protein